MRVFLSMVIVLDFLEYRMTHLLTLRPNAKRSMEPRLATICQITPFMDNNEMVFDTYLDINLNEGESIRHKQTVYPSIVFRRYMRLWNWVKLSQKRLELIESCAPVAILVTPMWSSTEEGLIYSLTVTEESLGDWLESVDRKAY